MTPTMDRLCKSGLKCAVLIAASRSLDDNVLVTDQDIIKAFYYVEQWIPHTNYIINIIGMSPDEKNIQRVYSMVKVKPGVMRSDIMRNLRLNARNMDSIVATLQQRGLIDKKREGRIERYYPMETKV
jgi:hypothetical protein